MRRVTPQSSRTLAAIFVGGGLGAMARVEVAEALPVHPGAFPWATLLVNVVGAALLGWFTTRLQERLPLSVYRRPFLGTGICGGLTTFSTMQVELLKLLDRGDVGLALLYAVTSVVAGLAAVLLATNLVRWSL
jgi:fluoride exporter